MKILLCGDSFAADWSVKYPERLGWCNWLANDYSVTNIAQAGVGEYKILQQVKSVNLKKFDAIIIAHTSPNRVHCVHHPIHYNDVLHKNADLIYNDVAYHHENSDAKIAVKYFERYFDHDYYNDIANLICLDILNILGNYPHLNQFHIENCIDNQKYDVLPDSFNINILLKKYHGNTCHLNTEGNKKLYNVITK